MFRSFPRSCYKSIFALDICMTKPYKNTLRICHKYLLFIRLDELDIPT